MIFVCDFLCDFKKSERKKISDLPFEDAHRMFILPQNTEVVPSFVVKNNAKSSKISLF